MLNSIHGKKLTQELILAASLVSIIFLRQIANILDPHNTYYFIWTGQDSLRLIATIIILTLVLAAIPIIALIKNYKWLETFYGGLVIALLCMGVFSNQTFIPPNSIWETLIFTFIVALASYHWGAPQKKIAALAKVICLIFSPVFLIVLFLVGTNKTWGPATSGNISPSQINTHNNSNITFPVIFAIFDAWSWEKSTVDNDFLPIFKNLNTLSENSFVFHNANSPSTTTVYSIPKIIYQSDLINEQLVPWDYNTSLNSPNTQNIFQLAENNGYATNLVGFHFPYAKMFQTQVDYCFSPSASPKKGPLFFLLNNLHYMIDPFSREISHNLSAYMYSKNWFRINQAVAANVKEVIAKASANTMLFAHWPLPHWPFCMNEDGSYRWHGGDDRGPKDPDGHMRHLKLVDKQIGMIVDELKKAKLYEKALIILSADHGYITDKEISRVPLIVKLPYQEEGAIINARTFNNQLGEIITCAIEGRMDTLVTLKDTDSLEKYLEKAKTTL